MGAGDIKRDGGTSQFFLGKAIRAKKPVKSATKKEGEKGGGSSKLRQHLQFFQLWGGGAPPPETSINHHPPGSREGEAEEGKFANSSANFGQNCEEETSLVDSLMDLDHSLLLSLNILDLLKSETGGCGQNFYF